MLAAALESSSWISASRWEIEQQGWSRTLEVLKHHQKAVEQFYSSTTDRIPKVMLLAGADIVKSFMVEGAWIRSQLEELLTNFGVVCIERDDGSEHLQEAIDSSPFLSKFSSSLILVEPAVPVVNNVSSSLARELISRGLSAKFVVPDEALAYIEEHQLYGCEKGTQNTVVRSML
eukprot:TRINITY_DN4161_c0_g1_i5.p1 TRINITY_DN4161_c0_g1~~TRINITY_DN4161_c0_g1_i5.p1  ORF type:complete len:175 (-),score=39.94 TRINITY_DN4161_c0_g1_i5:425-949(-)